MSLDYLIEEGLLVCVNKDSYGAGNRQYSFRSRKSPWLRNKEDLLKWVDAQILLDIGEGI
jgi:hypothetical protein